VVVTVALERHTGGGALTRALRSPAAFGLAGLGAVVAVVAGLPAVAVAAVGVAGYGLGASVAAAVRSAGRQGAGGRRERIDPFTLGEPWRLRVRDALAARNRYDKALEGVAPGPLRERLADIGGRVEAGVQECWRVATQGNALSQGLSSLRIGDVRRSLAAAEAEAGAGAEADRRVAALRAQVGSAERMEATAADADDRLRLLTARLDEAAARAVELALGAGTDADVLGLGSEVDEVVDQLESLRLALDEVER
jgi:hypothetical protein